MSDSMAPAGQSADLHPHRRYNPLTGEWILVSPHRNLRPWQGAREAVTEERRPAYDPGCYLCPGNRRAGQVVNPPYDGTFVFANDFPALLPDTPPGALDAAAPAAADAAGPPPLFRAEAVQGECRVICFSPRHDLTLAELAPADLGRVIEAWTAQDAELAARHRWVQIFENKGAAMGCSNPHPHGQIWASSFLPHLIDRELRAQAAYARAHGRPLLLDAAERELADGARVVEQNRDWVMVVPYWAAWPFELLLLPRRAVARLGELRDEERGALAEILSRALIRYDNLFETSFPYSFGWHGAPGGADPADGWQLHAHFFPPLLRSATVRKFMVGYEMMAEPQRDLTAEQAAARLRGVPAVHYRQGRSGAAPAPEIGERG